MTDETLPMDRAARLLLHELGPELTAALMGTGDRHFSRVWQSIRQANDEQAARLRTGYTVVMMIGDKGGFPVARAWMMGMNPHLGDESPTFALAQDRHRDVLAAARAYIEGSSVT